MKTKKQFKWFTIFEYEKEQEYLRDMHKKGWKFVKVSGFGMYHFQECQPEDVVYQLDYNQEGLSQKDEYLKMFNDCGWEYLQDYAGYSYFRKSVSESGIAEEIFCDDESRLQMMGRVIKGRMPPFVVVFFAILYQFVSDGIIHENYIVAIIWGIILTLYLSIFFTCAKKYFEYKNKINK